jgi:hypothetical protein
LAKREELVQPQIHNLDASTRMRLLNHYSSGEHTIASGAGTLNEGNVTSFGAL